MAYRSSGGPYYKGTFDGSTKLLLIDNLCDILVTQLGWTRVSGDGTNDQLLQTPATPQGSQFRLRFQDYGHANCIQILPRNLAGNRMMSDGTNGSLCLYAANPRTYTFVGSPYQWFCYTAGNTPAREWYMFSMPWMPAFFANKITSFCMVMTNMWHHDSATLGVNYRNGNCRQRQNWGWILNDHVYWQHNWDNDTGASPKFAVPTNAHLDGLRVSRWIDGKALLSDPLVAFATSNDPYITLRGQLWDSYWSAESNLIMDEEVAIGGLNYKNMFGPTGGNSTYDQRGSLLMRIP